MKNLNVLLSAAVVLSLNSVAFADTAKEATRCAKAIVIKKTVEGSNPKCAFSPNKKFFAVMLRNEKDLGTSIKVYNTDTEEVVFSLTADKKTIRKFKLTNEKIVIKYSGFFKKHETYTLSVKCKKCKKTLDDSCVTCGKSRIGMMAKARAFGFVPVRKK